MNSGIYCIKNLRNLDRYIGQTADFKQRKYRHLWELRNNSHPNKHLQASWNKYGSDAFVFEIIEYCEKDELTIREQWYVDWWKPEYNIQVECVDSSKGVKRSEEFKKRVSEVSRKNLINKKFGRLTVIEQVGKNNRGNYLWKCICDCKKTIIVRSDSLISGTTKSCGCLQKEKASEIRKKSLIDLTGKKFGKLTVIEKTNKPENVKSTENFWLCQCSCENKTLIKVVAHSLKSGNTKSCGCLRKSNKSNSNSELFNTAYAGD